MVGDHLEQNNHDMIEFSIPGEARKMVSGTASLDFHRADVGQYRDLLDKSPLGGSFKGRRNLGRMDIVQERSLEGIGTDCRYVRKDKPTRKKTSLSEQRGWQLRKTTKMLSGYPGRKLEVQKTKWSLTGLLQ